MNKYSLYILIALTLLYANGCSEYNKILKSPNPELKYKKAVEYFEAEEYSKSLPLFLEILPLYKGTEKGRKIYIYYAYNNYNLGYLLIAAYHFRKYASTFSMSDQAEEAMFMSAYCNYLDSPGPSLDQTPSLLALEEFQLFVNTYPESELVDSANTIVDKLNLKIENKAFENSKQYYNIRKFKSAIVALNNFLADYPASQYKEEAKILVLKSYYELATNSIFEKKKERYDKGIEAYYDFIDNFAGSVKIDEAEVIYAKLVKEREEFLIENPDQNEL